jgi:hypothetical protein
MYPIYSTFMLSQCTHLFYINIQRTLIIYFFLSLFYIYLIFMLNISYLFYINIQYTLFLFSRLQYHILMLNWPSMHMYH